LCPSAKPVDDKSPEPVSKFANLKTCYALLA
jgi:hypothetical protein